MYVLLTFIPYIIQYTIPYSDFLQLGERCVHNLLSTFVKIHGNLIVSVPLFKRSYNANAVLYVANLISDAIFRLSARCGHPL